MDNFTVKAVDINAPEMEHVKGLIIMLSNRVERLEKKIDALDEEKRVASKKEFNEAVSFFSEELDKLNQLI
ncbi:hypothetical protein M3210_03050 [Oceanobacillus luteolus]|uniref:hypothetical protein n=1 Tax=Oceanobacillus luteolus TaxID=1274358 RepID=UPI00203FF1F7|nr:hypothetical protein [Oceanobacillus luteolus]MCM3739241.1 hypothetical protein [Oceanobacillus luteolus]